MRNLAKIVKDKNNAVYLKVYDKNVKVLAYFKIEEYNTDPEGKVEELSDVFSIDLSGEK
jgi:hypothetical protein